MGFSAPGDYFFGVLGKSLNFVSFWLRGTPGDTQERWKGHRWSHLGLSCMQALVTMGPSWGHLGANVGLKPIQKGGIDPSQEQLCLVSCKDYFWTTVLRVLMFLCLRRDHKASRFWKKQQKLNRGCQDTPREHFGSSWASLGTILRRLGRSRGDLGKILGDFDIEKWGGTVLPHTPLSPPHSPNM